MDLLQKAMLEGRAVAVPTDILARNMEEAGYNTKALWSLDAEWVTVYPDSMVMAGITEDADMEAVGDLLRQIGRSGERD